MISDFDRFHSALAAFTCSVFRFWTDFFSASSQSCSVEVRKIGNAMWFEYFLMMSRSFQPCAYS